MNDEDNRSVVAEKSEIQYESNKKKIINAFKGKWGIIAGAAILCIFIIGMCIFIFGGNYSLDEKAAHSYYGFDSPYSKGDYLYSTVTFTGDALGKEKVMTVKNIEKLAFDSEKQIGFQNKYSMLSEDGTFVTHRYVGAKLYKLLLYLGMDEDTPDDTPVTVYGRSGKVFSYKLADIKTHNNSRYKKTDSKSYEETDIETILAFGMDSLPLTGPVGAQSNDVVLGEKDGYNKKVDNSGGPLRLVSAQKSASDENAARSGKNIKKIVIGKEKKKTINTDKKASKKQLTISLYNGGNKLYGKKTFSLADIERFAVSDEKNKVSSFYNGKNYYSGADLKNLIRKSMGFNSASGTVTFRYRDSSSEILDLAYIMKQDSNYSEYRGVVEDRKITGVKPGIAYSKNSAAIPDSDILVLLPACSDKKSGVTVKQCEEIELHVDGGKDSTQSLAASRINVWGDGVEKARSYTVSELIQNIRKMEMVDGEFKGVSLEGLLKKTGLTFDAEKVRISNGNEAREFTVSEIMNYKKTAVIGVLQNTKLISRKTGPVVLRGDKSLDSIISIEVIPKSKYWNHLFGTYEQYLDTKLVITGSEVRKRSYTLKDLELLGYRYTVKDQYAAARKGKIGFKGVILKNLIDANLRSGVKIPSAITITTEDGTENRLDVKNVYSSVKSKVDSTEKRKTIIAYAQSGMPLVPGKKSDGYLKNNNGGPLKLIIENQPAKWSDRVVKITVGK